VTKQDTGKQGWVALAGAGPGDDGLLTVRAAEVLRAADLVVVEPERADLVARYTTTAKLAEPGEGAATAKLLTQAK
jgi:uroporphyrinogen III methyltransferase / synthase